MERDDQNPNENQGPTFNEASEQLMGNLGELRDLVAQRTEEIRDRVSSFVQDRPIAAVGIAFGVGYILSGALVSRTTGRLLGLGTRFLLAAVVKQAIAGGGLGALAAMAQRREMGDEGRPRS